jgi:putative nucleotidyltransferase with HDIG domain
MIGNSNLLYFRLLCLLLFQPCYLIEVVNCWCCMIKKVKVEDLKVGVYVHDFNCDRNSERIYLDKNIIKNQNTIDILKSWRIKEVLIDTERGLDVDNSGRLLNSRKEIKEGKSGIDQTGKVNRPEVSLSRELQPAKKIAYDAIKLLQDANQLVMEGKIPEIGPAYDLAERMRESMNRNWDALLLLTRIRNKDEYTLFHSVSVSSLVLNMCRYLKTPEDISLNLAVGALFHDIGKTRVSENILKKPGKLDEEEYRKIQKHTTYAVDILQNVRGLPFECYDIALHHHERFGGGGYPRGLKGDQISQDAQLASICDVFDAITAERSYSSATDTVTGLRKIYEAREIFFKAELANDFIRCIGVYPVGTCVVLDDGRVGVVISSTEDIMQPVVVLLYDEKKKERLKPQNIDLSKTNNAIVSYGDPKKIGLTSQQLLKKLVS